MFGLSGAAAEYALAIPGVALVIVFAGLFMTMNTKNLQQAEKQEERMRLNQEKMQANQEKMLNKSFEQVLEIQESTIKNISSNTIMAARATGQELLGGVTPIMLNQQSETQKNTESIKTLSGDISKLELTIKAGIKDLGEKDQNNFNLAKADMDRNINTVNTNVERVNTNVKTVETAVSNLTGIVKNLEGRFTTVEVMLPTFVSKKSQADSAQKVNLSGDVSISDKPNSV